MKDLFDKIYDDFEARIERTITFTPLRGRELHEIMETIDPTSIPSWRAWDSPIDITSAANRSFALESINKESMSFFSGVDGG